MVLRTNPPAILELVFAGQNHVPIIDCQTSDLMLEALDSVVTRDKCATEQSHIRLSPVVQSCAFKNRHGLRYLVGFEVVSNEVGNVCWEFQRHSQSCFQHSVTATKA